MFIGRVVGWVLLGVALLMASGDAVLALSPGDHLGLVTGDFWILLAGRALQPDVLPSFLGARLMDLPAWAIFIPAGLTLLLVCRPRRRHRYLFRGAR